jgi:hypothetical protein
MSQTQGTCTTNNSRCAGTIPGLSATQRTGLPCTPVQALSTFGTSAYPSNIFCTSGAVPPSLSPSISTRLSAFNNPVDNNCRDPEEPTPISPLKYAPPGSDRGGDDLNPTPQPNPDKPDPPIPPILPGLPDMLNQFLGGLHQLHTALPPISNLLLLHNPKKSKFMIPTLSTIRTHCHTKVCFSVQASLELKV